MKFSGYIGLLACVVCVLSVVRIARNGDYLQLWPLGSGGSIVEQKSDESESSLRGYAWEVPEGTRLPRISLPIIYPRNEGTDTTFTLPTAAGAKAHLFVVFSYTDCYSGFADIPFWSELRREFGATIEVVGVTAGGTPNAIRHFVTQQGIDMPVLWDEERKIFGLLARLGYAPTPLLLLTTMDGTVVHVLRSPYGDRSAQVAYMQGLRSLAMELNAPS